MIRSKNKGSGLGAKKRTQVGIVDDEGPILMANNHHPRDDAVPGGAAGMTINGRGQNPAGYSSEVRRVDVAHRR